MLVNSLIKKTCIALAIACLGFSSVTVAKTTARTNRHAKITKTQSQETTPSGDVTPPVSDAGAGTGEPAQATTTVTLPEQVRKQAPGYYRMMIGQIEVTALFDGTFDFHPELLKNGDEQKMKALLSHYYGSLDGIQSPVNAYLIHTGEHLVLIDAGCGALFGDKQGRVIANLKAAGYSPEQVDTIIFTHLHGDHTGGLSNTAGDILFPNAKIYANRLDNEYWLSEKVAAAAPPERQMFFKLARASTVPYLQAEKWQSFENGAEVVPGIKAIGLYGHTPGHTAYLISSQGQRLLVWGDIVHAPVLQFANPSISIEYDSDQPRAVATRLQLFAKVAEQKLLVAGAHIPFPGIGYVRSEGQGKYSWVPVEYTPLQ